MLPLDYNCIIKDIKTIDYSTIFTNSFFQSICQYTTKLYNVTSHFRRPFHWGTKKLMSACENPTLYVLNKRRARKQHKCCECGGIIEIGEVYCCHRGVWDSSWYVFKVCDDCDKLRMRVDTLSRRELWDELTAFTELAEAIASCSDAPLVKEFIRIKEKRSVEVPKYLVELYDRLANEDDVRDEELAELTEDEQT